MKEVILKYKYFIYPIIVLLAVVILSLLNLNGLSVGIYNAIVSRPIEEDNNLLIGKPRGIRGDQFLVVIPTIVSQDINNEKIVNSDIGEGTNLGTQNVPTRSFFSLFRPTYLPFYFTDNTNFSYSFSWWADFALLLISIYLLLLVITKKNLLISIIGSLIFLATPFFQWWNQVTIVTWISFGIFFFIKILTSDTKWKSVLYGLGLSYSIVAFILLLYPPFQVSVAYIAVAVAIGFVIANWNNIKRNIKTTVPTIIFSVLISVVILALFYIQFKDVISITMNTVYPGARFISAGMGNLNHLLDGFYNILLQKDSNIAPFGNQSESSNFFLLFMPVVIWITYKNIQLKRKGEKLDWIAICLATVLVFFTAWYFLPLPDFISRYSLLYLIHPNRLLIGFGYGSYLLMFYILSKNKIYRANKSTTDKILLFALSIGYGILIYKVGRNIYAISPDFFKSPTIVNYNYKILLATILTIFLTYMLLKGYPKIFLVIFLTFSFLSTIFINPLYKGLDVLTNTNLSNYIEEVSKKNDSKWIAYNNHYLAQYALANNASVINGIHYYPQFKIWNILDPDKKYIDIYNRYAHINISEYEEGEEYIRLVYQDALEVNISPCDKKLDELNVKYIITNQDMSDYTCLKFKKAFLEYGINIYDRTVSTTPSLP